MTRSSVRYLRWLAAMLQGDWGFSFAAASTSTR